MGAMSDMRIGGLVLIVSAGMTIVLSLLAPGGPLIEPVSQFDFVAASEVLGDYANLTHATSLLFAIAMLLVLYGLVSIWRAVPAEGGMDSVARIGLLMLVFSICCLIVTMGLNHAIVHVSMHGIGSEQPEARLQDLAQTLQSTKFGLRYIAGAIAILGLALLSFGLSTRLPAGFNKVAARLTAACSALGLILVLIIEHFHDIDIAQIAQASLLLVVVTIVWVIILSMGLYKGSLTSPQAPQASGRANMFFSSGFGLHLIGLSSNRGSQPKSER